MCRPLLFAFALTLASLATRRSYAQTREERARALCGNNHRDVLGQVCPPCIRAPCSCVTSREECDGTDFGGQTCRSRGYASGALRCEACGIETDACSVDIPQRGGPRIVHTRGSLWTTFGHGVVLSGYPSQYYWWPERLAVDPVAPVGTVVHHDGELSAFVPTAMPGGWMVQRQRRNDTTHEFALLSEDLATITSIPWTAPADWDATSLRAIPRVDTGPAVMHFARGHVEVVQLDAHGAAEHDAVVIPSLAIAPDAIVDTGHHVLIALPHGASHLVALERDGSIHPAAPLPTDARVQALTWREDTGAMLYQRCTANDVCSSWLAWIDERGAPVGAPVAIEPARDVGREILSYAVALTSRDSAVALVQRSGVGIHTETTVRLATITRTGTVRMRDVARAPSASDVHAFATPHGAVVGWMTSWMNVRAGR